MYHEHGITKRHYTSRLLQWGKYCSHFTLWICGSIYIYISREREALSIKFRDWVRKKLRVFRRALNCPTFSKPVYIHTHTHTHRAFRAQADWVCRELLGTSYQCNYYIWLIINESSTQCVLAVPAARHHFSRQVAKGFRRKLPSVSQGTISLRSEHPEYTNFFNIQNPSLRL
jgi:hypothetical protein